jgi:hypothetical protein
MVAQGLVLALGLAIVYLVQNRAAIARRLHRHRSAHVVGDTG